MLSRRTYRLVRYHCTYEQMEAQTRRHFFKSYSKAITALEVDANTNYNVTCVLYIRILCVCVYCRYICLYTRRRDFDRNIEIKQRRSGRKRNKCVLGGLQTNKKKKNTKK
jgi:hypothetical protein